ncbi:hypothetical protein GIY62_17365 [Burkholderia plantarii]|uniref:hypothetical protein n=1 Tax=Burkholderia plantarii TaxID=41899 RepID=UPI00272D5151|nr:hypothetical protein [Burkholderia plantarii]WLE58854.1 hypothetical protein GIY62_17365 [Burkholderia plantarii]
MPLSNVVRLKPRATLGRATDSHAVWFVRHVCAISKGWCVLNQHEISTTNTASDGATTEAGSWQLPASTAAATNNEHRVIVDNWLRCAIDGICTMHLDNNERRRVAKRLF